MWVERTGLEPTWEAALAQSLAKAKPHLQSKALAGIFLGDERSCGGIPFSNVTAVADAVKAFLRQHAPSALVYLLRAELNTCFLSLSRGVALCV